MKAKYTKLVEDDTAGSGNENQKFPVENRKRTYICTMLKWGALATLVVAVVLAVVCGSVIVEGFPGNPLHASCDADWTTDMSCSDVSNSLQMQIKKWMGSTGCENGGEKCLYTLISANKTMLVGTHETPVKHYIDNFEFTFKQVSPGPGCMMHGHSSSALWYAVLDKGTNYCNLENLITGSGIDQSSGYTEKTSDAVCTEYSSADCEKY